MKWSLRTHPDAVVVTISTLVAFAFATVLSRMISINLTDAPFLSLFSITIALSTGMALTAISILFAVVVRTGNFPRGALLYVLQTISILSLIGLQTFLAVHTLDPTIAFLIAGAIIFISVLTSVTLLTSLLEKIDETALLTGVGAIALILIYSNFRLLGPFGTEQAILHAWRETSILILCHPVLFAIQHYLRSFQGVESERKLYSFRQPGNVDKALYGIHLLGAALQIASLSTVLSYNSNSTGWIGTRMIWSGLAFSLVPVFYWTCQLWRHRPIHKVGKPQSASWIGMKTAVLLIDHDPHEECRMHLPALLYRARQLQCEQIIQRTFAKSILSQTAAGSQISLALDPRASASPCVEALTIMSVIYIDGLSLVEGRLKNLVNLLPLLDPKMALSLNSNELEFLFSRLQGFFHLDYSWIDQSRDENKSQLDIRLEHLNSRQRQRVLMQLSNSQWLGNFIWISEGAREQIRIESPYLLTAIERLPIKIEYHSGKIFEAGIYLMKYENLIPRLQHYYNFDEIRARLSPRPMATEALSLVQSLEEEILLSFDFSGYHKLLTQIRLFEWQGFQAKDQALDLVLRIMAKATALEHEGKIREQDFAELLELSRQVIHEIGYPSQDFHIEHLQKLELRQIQELHRTCLDRSHSRFEEAWLILASIPTSTIDFDLALRIFNIIRAAAINLELKADSLVVGKCIETFFSLARYVPGTPEPELVHILNLLAEILVHGDWEPDMLVSFLDKKVALDQFRGHSLPFYDEVRKRWEKKIQTLKHENISGVAKSLVMRWALYQEDTPIAS